MRRWPSVLGVFAFALCAAAPAAHVAPGSPQSAGYVFSAGAGVLFFHVRPDRTADFEAVTARIGALLDQTQDATRRQQAASWRIYKSTEAPAEAAVYLFFFDPAVAGADYDPLKLLGEAAPVEAHAAYEKLKAAVIRVERMALAKLR